jgi:hypothetical protein
MHHGNRNITDEVLLVHHFWHRGLLVEHTTLSCMHGGGSCRCCCFRIKSPGITHICVDRDVLVLKGFTFMSLNLDWMECLSFLCLYLDWHRWVSECPNFVCLYMDWQR